MPPRTLNRAVSRMKRGESAPKGSRGETSSYVQRYMTDENYTILEKLDAFARSRNRAINELAHAWLLAHPLVSSVISGATKVEHVLANAKSAKWELTAEELEDIEIILKN